MKYNNHLNYRDRRRLILKLRIIYLVLGLLIIGGAVIFYFKFVKDNVVNDHAVSGETKSIVAPTITTFKSQFFQFQANNSWVEVPKESTANKFVYRSYNKTLVEHELVVFVNQVPNPMDFKSDRVLPVEITNTVGQTSKLSPTNISDPCGVALKKDGQYPDVQSVTYKGVNFTCFGKISEYNVIVGQNNGGTSMTMRRADNTTAVYTIQYKDLRAINGPSEIMQITNSFQSL